MTIFNDSMNLNDNALSPASKASREVENLTERKNPHTPVRICLSIRLLQTLTPRDTSLKRVRLYYCNDTTQ